MKKFVMILAAINIILPAYSIVPPDAAVIQVHDLQMINQQRFRIEEINDFNDVETEKARYEKRYNSSQSTSLIDRLFKKKKFVEKDGQIKIEAESN